MDTRIHRLRPLATLCAVFALACGSGKAASSSATGGSGASGGSGTAGGPGASGGAGAAAGGSGGSSTGPFPVQMCTAGTATCAANTVLPPSAPVLTAGMWRDISPVEVPFGNTDPNNPTFTQGIAVDPCNAATLYLCVDGFDTTAAKAGLYKSTDAGSSWTKIARVIPNFTGVDHLDEPIRVRIDPKNPQHLYVVDGVRGGTSGFWFSCDGGENFSQPESFAKLQADKGIYSLDTYDIAVDPTDFNHALVASHSGWNADGDSGVLETTDGGSNWTVHMPLAGWGTGHAITFLFDLASKQGDSSTWLLSTQGGSRWRTSDAGSTWTKVSSDAGIEHGGGTFYYDKNGVLYASGFPSNQRSTDNGEHWLNIGGGSGTTAIIGDGTTLFSAPAFGPTPFLTSPESDGLTWTPLNSQEFKQGPFEMVFDRANEILYSGTWLSGMLAYKE